MTTDIKKVTHIANYFSDAMLWTPKGMLYDACRCADEEYKHVKKALVIFYDEENEDNRMRIRWIQAGMKRSEIMNLLSLTKDDLLLDMFDRLDNV